MKTNNWDSFDREIKYNGIDYYVVNEALELYRYNFNNTDNGNPIYIGKVKKRGL